MKRLDGTLRVLIVDDDEVDRAWARRALARVCADGGIHEASSAEEAFLAIVEGEHDCAVIDHHLAGETGLELTRRLREDGREVPIVMLTGAGDEQLAVSVMKSGAADYLAKDLRTPDGLRRAVRAVVSLHRARLEREALVEDLERERERLARAVRDRDEVLAIVSHDLRSPLATIAMAAEELRADPSEEVIEMIGRNVKRAERLIQDLLEVSKIERGALALEMSALRLADLCHEAAESARPAARKKGVELALECDAATTAIDGDAHRLRQTLDNLLTNAIRHTPSGGRVTLGARLEGDAARLYVVDTGEGIRPEALPHLFDRFYQSSRERRGGAGLGLAIVKGIVEAHGGEVSASEAEGGGARFDICLPLRPRLGAAPTQMSDCSRRGTG